MAKRIFDLLFSAAALVVTAPLLLLIAIAILAFDGGPVLYRALRQGTGGAEFTLYKFRTMKSGADKSGAITGIQDDRVFPFGSFLRRSKLDELPQFWNVLTGDMSIVGPRPEDVDIVSRCYTAEQIRTLSVRPGIASPGSVFNYTHAEGYLDCDDVAGSYENGLLPVKLGLELVYVDDMNFIYDLRIMARTVSVVFRMLVGQRHFPLPPEHSVARTRGYIDD